MANNLFLRCSKCSRTFSFITNNPLEDIIIYCPSCGSDKIKLSPTPLNYWKELSIEYKVPEVILKEMFSIWDPDDDPSFAEFVKFHLEKVA